MSPLSAGESHVASQRKRVSCRLSAQASLLPPLSAGESHAASQRRGVSCRLSAQASVMQPLRAGKRLCFPKDIWLKIKDNQIIIKD